MGGESVNWYQINNSLHFSPKDIIRIFIQEGYCRCKKKMDVVHDIQDKFIHEWFERTDFYQTWLFVKGDASSWTHKIGYVAGVAEPALRLLYFESKLIELVASLKRTQQTIPEFFSHHLLIVENQIANKKGIERFESNPVQDSIKDLTDKTDIMFKNALIELKEKYSSSLYEC